MDFPQFISFTLTNACNLRCRMCGQWSETGYITNKVKDPHAKMDIADWKRLVDEITEYDIRSLLIRGGEPFLYPGVMELLEYIRSKNIFIAIDSNGMLIHKYAKDLINLGNIHITFSVDGPEEIHDAVRGVKGSFQKIKDNINLLNDMDKDQKIGKSICFTISKYSYKGLGQMPAVARSMGIKSINIVPYYYFSEEIGKQYEKELKENFGGTAYSWKGFYDEDSDIDPYIFKEQYQAYLADLGDIENFPFMPLSEDEYLTWFRDTITPVTPLSCTNVERLIDIQPNGECNFCIDFPDYIIGNVKDSTLKELWNSPEAECFRAYRRKQSLAVCYRCGAKYCPEIRD
jgi:MoaA/NifB/PqqE/SkfB family radical SAM enzyme